MDFSSIKVGIVTLTVGNWDLMPNHLDSIVRTYPYPKEFYIVPNFNFEVSLATTLNKGFKRAINENCNYIVYSADDTIIGEDCLQTIINKVVEEDLWFCGAQGVNCSGWDTFVVNPIVFSDVGFFDEGFYPAYFEDNDFAYRMDIKNKDKVGYIPANLQHLGSETLKRLPGDVKLKHQRYFALNRERYAVKWGGPPKQEIFLIPWNGEPPNDYLDALKRYGGLV